MRDRLVELIKRGGVIIPQTAEAVADHLLSEGVIVPKVKIGDKLYELSASKTKLYEITVTHLEVHENDIRIWGKEPQWQETEWICSQSDLGNNEWIYLTADLEAVRSRADETIDALHSEVRELTSENEAWQQRLISEEEKSGKAYYDLACEVEDLRAENERLMKALNTDISVVRVVSRGSGKTTHLHEVMRIKADAIRAAAVKEIFGKLESKLRITFINGDEETAMLIIGYDDYDAIKKEMVVNQDE